MQKSYWKIEEKWIFCVHDMIYSTEKNGLDTEKLPHRL